ncbi:MAG: ABC transporter permease subunit [Lachnospiraceae bacterium]|nr:ABC transporter permease subunit [Lachnospiraceae bacterium]
MKEKKEKKQKVIGYIEHGGIKALPHNLALDFKRNKVIYFLCIPIIVWYIIFHYVPMAGIVMAFEKFKPALGIFRSKWIGFGNFVEFFKGPYFLRLLRNTAALGILDIIFGFPAPIIFALLLNEVKNIKFKKVTQTISYMPYFISMVVVAGIIIDFTKSGGVISNIVASLRGTTPENLLGNVNYFRPIFILSGIWQGVGYGSIIYIAALSSVDQELYEAAVMDGANRWKQTIHITIPSILPTIIMLLIMRMGSILAVASDKVLLLYSPGIYEKADVISTYVYRIGLEQANYGLASAVGLFNSIVGTVFLLTTNAISKKLTETSLF